MGGADGGDQVDGAADLLGGVDLLTGSGLDPADVDHVRALGDHPVHPLHRRGHGVGGAAVVERVWCPVHDRHQHERAVWHVQGTDPEQPVPSSPTPMWWSPPT
jgi:hypothetical protein